MHFSTDHRLLKLAPLLLSLAGCATNGGKTALQAECEGQGVNSIYLNTHVNDKPGRTEYCVPNRMLAKALSIPADDLETAISRTHINGFGLPSNDPETQAAFRIGTQVELNDLDLALIAVLKNEVASSNFAKGLTRVVLKNRDYEPSKDVMEAMLKYPGQLKEFTESNRNNIESTKFYQALIEKIPEGHHKQLLDIAEQFPDSLLTMGLLLNDSTREKILPRITDYINQLEGQNDTVAQAFLGTAFNLKDELGFYVINSASQGLETLLEYSINNALQFDSSTPCAAESCDRNVTATLMPAFSALATRKDRDNFLKDLPPDLQDQVNKILEQIRMNSENIYPEMKHPTDLEAHIQYNLIT